MELLDILRLSACVRCWKGMEELRTALFWRCICIFEHFMGALTSNCFVLPLASWVSAARERLVSEH